MIDNISIAIVIPMYNCATSIIQVLDSISSQTMIDNVKKIILVNDGSNDNTIHVCKHYKKNSSLPIEIIDKPNGGVASARNEGLKKVSDVGWVAFCDSDDLWLPHKLERQIEVLKDNPQIDVLGSAYNETPLKIGFKTITNLHKGTVREICIKNFPQPSTVIMRSSIYYAEGGFDEEQHYAEDGNYFLKIAAKYNLYYLPELLICYGYGKRGFGVSGLSSNLKGMYDGNIKNLKEIKQMRYISFTFYILMRIFHLFKYYRRIFITSISKNKNG